MGKAEHANRDAPAAGTPLRKVTPLYHRVYVVLRGRILAGEYPADEPLPGEHRLAEEFGVSRVTIRHTLKNLELDGFIETRRGVGSFPLARPADLPDRYNIDGLLEPGRLRDEPARVRTLSLRTVSPPAYVVRELGPGPVLRIERLRSIKREPFTILTVYLPEAVAGELDRKELRREPALTVLERHGYHLARADQSISATAADDESASLLRVPVGSPLLTMWATFSGAEDEPLAFLEALFRPELYEYKSSMLREGRGATARWKPLP